MLEKEGMRDYLDDPEGLLIKRDRLDQNRHRGSSQGDKHENSGSSQGAEGQEEEAPAHMDPAQMMQAPKKKTKPSAP